MSNSSKSKSSQSQQSTTSYDAGQLNAAGQLGEVIKVGDVTGNRAQVHVSIQRTEPETLPVLQTFGEVWKAADQRTAAQLSGVQATVSDIAKSATATQTETERMVSRLTLPLVLLGGAVVLIPLLRKAK